MKTKLALSVVAAAVALFSQAALAQTTAPAARADVKAEAATGAKAKPGEATPALGASAPMSTKTRAERKGDTKAAAAAGELRPAGTIDEKAEAAARKSGTTKTRAERKEEAKAATKVPAGERTPPTADVPLKK